MITKQVLLAADLLNELKTNPGSKMIDFCDENNLSKAFMEQIGRKLVAAKIIHSKRGPGGGYTLYRDVVSLSELVKVYQSYSLDNPLSLKAMEALENINVINA